MPLPATLHTSVFNSLEDQIAVIDQAGNILDVNLAWQKLGIENGLTSEYSCVGNNYIDTLRASVASGDNLAAEALQGIMAVLQGGRPVFYFEYPCHSPNEKRWFTMRITSLYGDEQRNLFVVSHHNITQRKLAEERIKELAMQDPLTGLANRRAFQLLLKREMRNSIRQQVPIGLILLDVDHFKDYNDKLGHSAGDQCLTKISHVLQAHARRSSDLAARIGGDEFALILGGTPLDKVRDIADSILRDINKLKMIFGDNQQATASIGLVAVVPDEHHRYQNKNWLFDEADKALYRAKSAGRNQISCVNEES